ncbi:hypothetical protein RclHR1_08530009 [Rhizophagus clarus]|uniref:K Homology domain-containing protein n=1 Tax=Rhizophagus clarus TaxID=94130 RepID=A0A2Z6S0U5_9GLOM|nr:hypothetical protein RclHR1_08530009 [Rhizophagus clarus]
MTNPTKDIFKIPKGKSGYIIGPSFSNLNRIKASSGANIQINGRRNQPCQAIITGTTEQRKEAIKLLQESLLRSNSFSPTIGFILLDEQNDNFGSKLLLFNKIPNSDNYNDFKYNDLHKTYNKYTLEIIPSTMTLQLPSPSSSPPSSPKHNNLSISGISGKLYSFNTTSKLDCCLNEIVEQITSKNFSRKTLKDNEFRLKINFGVELFTKIDQTIINLSDWHELKRGHKGITTAFRHDISFFNERKIEKLKRNFSFKEINMDNEDEYKESCYITVLYKEKDKKNKFKLKWNANEGCWKITKLTENISRQAIIDIVSGRNELPDLRFLLKSQKRSTSINEKYCNIINNLQKSRNFLKRTKFINNNKENLFNNNDKMYFRQDDFNGIFNCTGVRQSIIKKHLINDKYQLDFISTLQDEDGVVTLEDTVNLINLSWISSPECESIATMNPNNPKFINSIFETINYARKISRII